MRATALGALTAILVMAASIAAAPLPADAAEAMPIDRLEPLPLSFWDVLGAAADQQAVRIAYLRGFFEATHVWAATRPQPNAASRYLRMIQGMNLLQVANLVRRISKEYPQHRERLTLSEALTGCVVRARTGLPLLDEETVRDYGLEPAAEAGK